MRRERPPRSAWVQSDPWDGWWEAEQPTAGVQVDDGAPHPCGFAPPSPLVVAEGRPPFRRYEYES